MERQNEQLKLFKLNNKERLKYYVALSNIQVSPLFKAKLLEYFEYDVERAYNISSKDISKVAEYFEIPASKTFISKRDKTDIDKCFEEFLKYDDVNLITVEDDNYPPLLREIPDYPICLYYKGNLDNIDYNYSLAVVGSRNASNEAKIALESVLSKFGNSNVTIVSGLAYGIDAKAHQTALENNIRTIGVIGSGIDIIYPLQNKKLYYDIIQNQGAILSEYPLKMRPMPQNFPQRNRIITGMTKGTLVGEARLKSGAMISANFALDFNRELMCIPGNILNPNTSGIYYLIKNGAGVVSSSEDLLNYMNWNILNNDTSPKKKLNSLQEKIINVLELESKTFDDIISNIDDDVSEIMVCLTELEIEGLVKQTNNRYYKC